MLKRLAESEIPTWEVTPNDVRGAILSRPNAGKGEVQDFLDHIGFVVPRNRSGRVDDDIADSVMLGL